MRGEHALGEEERWARLGSSPHARGAPGERVLGRLRLGIIPACAGSTSRDRRRPHTGWDHPRMRGEHFLGPPVPTPARGSSPHARGAQVARLGHELAHGIIPACAGSTASRPYPWPAPRDHPRMRGEHGGRMRVRTVVKGSSPHARGAPVTCPALVDSLRIIPACAGSTPSPSRKRCSAWDHPRMRGEHVSVEIGYYNDQGSSPHARGARSCGIVAGRTNGIIPACAGSTSSTSTRAGARWDHPRMRGEHVLIDRVTVS